MFRKICLTLGILLASALSASAQGYHKEDTVVNQNGDPIVNALVTICASGATGIPCTPQASIYSDAALSVPKANPLTTGPLGNYDFYAAPGSYVYTINGPNITSTSSTLVLPCVPNNCPGVISSGGTIASGTAGNVVIYTSPTMVGDSSVPAAQLPLLNTHNIFTMSQSFKGPDPWRDITAYMPSGGCSTPNVNTSNGATGTISSGTAALTVDSARDWVNGCGITIDGAGPTATIVVPSCVVGTAASTTGAAAYAGGTTYAEGAIVNSGGGYFISLQNSNTGHLPSSFPTFWQAVLVGTIGITCNSNTNLVFTGTGGANGQDQGVQLTGCSDSTFNGTFLMKTSSATNQFTFITSPATSGATGCSVTFVFGYPHGIAGSTTYYYQISPIDTKGGLGAAVAIAPITTGNASLSVHAGNMNYNVVNYPFIVGSMGTVVWRSLDNSTWVCAGVNYMGILFEDWGYTGRCPTFVPSTPPASPTAEQLTTTIVSGAGTTSLVLAANAGNNASAASVYHDEMPFLTAAFNDATTDQGLSSGAGFNSGSYGVFIPAGTWQFNSNFPTALSSSMHGGMLIRIAGSPFITQWPWIVKTGYHLQGVGYSGGQINSSGFSTTFIGGSNRLHQSTVLAVEGGGVTVEGLDVNAYGTGIAMGSAPDGQSGVSGVKCLNDIVSMSSNATGVPLMIGGNTFKIECDNLVLTPRPDGFPASVLFTTDSFFGVGGADHEFNHLALEWHAFFANAPGGQQGEGFSWSANKMWTEEFGQYPTFGVITADLGDASPGYPGTRIASVGLNDYQLADASTKTAIAVLGTSTSAVFTPPITLDGDVFATLVSCPAPISTICQQGHVGPAIGNSGNGPMWLGSQQSGIITGLNGGAFLLFGYPTLFTSGPGMWYQTPDAPVWADVLPPPSQMVVLSTGSGNLSAGTYCFRAVNLDFAVSHGNNPATGATLPGPEACATVGASSSITLQWSDPTFNTWVYSDVRMYYATSIGGAYSNYIDTGIAPATSAVNITFTVSTLSGAVAGPIPTAPSAYESFFTRDKGACFYCITSSHATDHPFSVGDPSPATGSMVSIRGGYLGMHGTTSGGFQLGVAAVAGSPNPAYWPTASPGGANYVLSTDGGNPQQWFWAAPGSATWASLTAGSNSNAGSFISTGNTWDFSGAAHTSPVISVLTASLPAACAGGKEIAFATDATAGQNLYFCTSNNTWTQQLNSGASGAAVTLGNLSGVAINTTLLPASVNTVALGSNTLNFTNLFLGIAANKTLSFGSLSGLTANRVVTVPDAATVLPQAISGVSHQWLSALNSSTGVFSQSQPNFTDLAGSIALAQTSLTTQYDLLTVSGVPALTRLATGTAHQLLHGLNTWAAVDVTADITGTVPIANGGTNLTSATDDAVMVGNGTTFQLKVIPDCQDSAGNHLNYTQSSNTFGCGTTISTQTEVVYFDAAGINQSTPAPSFDLPGTNLPNPAALTGTNTQQAVLDYDDSVNESSSFKFVLPHTWTGNINADIYWLCSASCGSNAVKWLISTSCAAAGATYDTAYNTPQTITTNVGTAAFVTVSTQSSITLTGCAVDNLMHIKIGRDTTDSFTGTARLLGVRLTLQKTGS